MPGSKCYISVITLNTGLQCPMAHAVLALLLKNMHSRGSVLELKCAMLRIVHSAYALKRAYYVKYANYAYRQ